MHRQRLVGCECDESSMQVQQPAWQFSVSSNLECRTCCEPLQAWHGKLHVPGMFRAHVVTDMLAGTGDIGRMFTGSEVNRLMLCVLRGHCVCP